MTAAGTPERVPTPAVVRAAIARGIAFIAASQHPRGDVNVLLAHDARMDGPCVRDASVFATALAAYSLSFAPEPGRVLGRALDFLEGEQDERGLWGHRSKEFPKWQLLPPDLDDTSCACIALRKGGRRIPDNRSLLLRHRNREQLFYTWVWRRAALQRPIVTYWMFTRTPAQLGDVDAVVNANTLYHLGFSQETRAVAEHLVRVLDVGGETSSDKWYEDPFVIRYFFSRALTICGELGERGGRMIVERSCAAIGRDGSILGRAAQTALGVCSLLDWRDDGPELERAVRFLIESQFDSGGWPRAALYNGGRYRRRGELLPIYHAMDRWGSEELTTAFCVEALSRWLARLA